MTTYQSTPFDIDVQFKLNLDTAVDTTYRQTSEDGFSPTGPVTIRDMIVERVATQLTDRIIKDATRYDGMRARVTSMLDAAVIERITPMLDAAFEAPIQKTNQYGEPQAGKTTTLRELVIESAQSQMTRRTDRYGNGKSVLETALEAITAAAIANELKVEIAAAKAKVRAQVAAIMAEAVAKVVAT